MKLKKLVVIGLCILTLTMVLCFATCCTNSSSYIGTYDSIFVDSQSGEDEIVFSLEINKDKTFKLSKSLSNPFTYKGTWKSYSESGKTQLLCLIEEGYKWNDKYPNAWHPYFTLSLLDDGTLMAVPSSTVNSYASSDTCFGKGDVTYITLVLFEKN